MNDTLEREYILGRSAEETERLQRQAAFFQPSTESLFRDAGLARGMKVLDLGSGAGDVALLAARMVGPEGAVVGVDLNPLILETACSRALEAGFDNVSFEMGDITNLSLPYDFDAVIGRLVLMYVPDPAAAIRTAMDHLRPGGIVAFQEPNFTHSFYSYPSSSLWDQTGQLLIRAFRESGADVEMGIKLRALCVKAGLSEVYVEGHRFMGGGPDWGGYDQIAGLVTSVLPFLEAQGIATAKELQPETLADRLRADIVSRDGIGAGGAFIRLWGRKTAPVHHRYVS